MNSNVKLASRRLGLTLLWYIDIRSCRHARRPQAAGLIERQQAPS